MKIFAEYFTENHINFRKVTLLQFGQSFDLIGSAILKNPGSSSPIGDVDEEELQILGKFYPAVLKTNWKLFKKDQTMDCLEKIFNGYYIGKHRTLNGIFKLFNLDYIVEKDIKKARVIFNDTNSIHKVPKIEEILYYINDKPVYLGWNKEPKEIKIPEIFTFSSLLFEKLKTTNSRYLLKEFNDNKFYHPIGVNNSYRFPELNETLIAFHKILI